MATTEALTMLDTQIAEARRDQIAARIAWARSPNADTTLDEATATHRLNRLLDRRWDATHGQP